MPNFDAECDKILNEAKSYASDTYANMILNVSIAEEFDRQVIDIIDHYVSAEISEDLCGGEALKS